MKDEPLPSPKEVLFYLIVGAIIGALLMRELSLL